MCQFIRLAVAAAVVAAAGCGGSGGPTATVSGTVTYNGQPVQEGSITFTPKSGKGAVSGGSITDGKFTVRGVPQGAVVVSVSAGGGGAEQAGPMSSEQAAAAATAAAQKGKGKSPAVAVPGNAVGNNAEVNVSGAEMNLNLDLKAPK